MKKVTTYRLTRLAVGLAALSFAPWLLAGNSPQAATGIAAQVRGTWRVTKVTSDPALKVAALWDNDPAYLGAVLTFSNDAVSWNSAKTNGKGTYDNCKKPNYVASSDEPGYYTIKCGSDSSGFDTTIKAISHDTLILNWYDGGILTLTRKNSAA
jgi:hypothetical protein